MSKRYRRWKMYNKVYNKGKIKTSFREYRRLRHSINKKIKKYDKLNLIFNSLPLHKSDFRTFTRYASLIFPEEKIYTGNLRNFQNKEEDS